MTWTTRNGVTITDQGIKCSYNSNWYGTWTEGDFLILWDEVVALCITFDMNVFHLSEFIHNNYGYMDDSIPSFIVPRLSLCEYLASKMVEHVTAIGG